MDDGVCKCQTDDEYIHYKSFEDYLQKNDLGEIKCDDCGIFISYGGFADRLLCVKCMKKEYEDCKEFEENKRRK